MTLYKLKLFLTAAATGVLISGQIANASAFVNQAAPQTRTAFVKQANQIAKQPPIENKAQVEAAETITEQLPEPAPRQNRILEFEVQDERMLLPSARITPLTRVLSQ